MSKPKALIVEDDAIIATDLEMIIEGMDFQVVGITDNSDEALDLMISRQPDIILLDINIIGERDGIQLAEIIREKIKKPFIYITSYTDRKTLERAKHTLPYGYIVKPFSESELKITIEIAIFRFQNEMDRAIPSREKINAILFQGLTEKEHDIMKDLYDGLANAQIASKHYISINTVKSHVKSIYNKISVHNRTELVKWLAGLK